MVIFEVYKFSWKSSNLLLIYSIQYAHDPFLKHHIMIDLHTVMTLHMGGDLSIDVKYLYAMSNH